MTFSGACPIGKTVARPAHPMFFARHTKEPMQRKSAAEHELCGTTRPDRPAQQASHCQAGRPRYPKHLSPAGRSEYKRMCQMLEKRGVLTPADYHAVALAAEVTARWIELKTQIGDAWTIQTVVTGHNGDSHTVTRPNCLIPCLNATEARLLAILKTLGLSPTDKDRAKPVAPPKSDEPQPGTVAYILREYERTHPDGTDAKAV